MNDDFNTPEALAVVFDLVRELNTAAVAQRPELAAQLLAMGNSLGLLQQKPETFLRLALHSAGEAGLVDQQVEALIVERLAARANKDWQQADEIRDQLTAAGIVLEDADGQTRWARR
jgi:cysteinyl-tRNA synthetase